MLPHSAFRSIGFADAAMGDYLLERGGEGAFIVGAIGEQLYAVMLEGQFAEHALPLLPDQPRSGLAIGGLLLEVDHTSWIQDRRRVGSVLCGGGRAMIVAQTRVGAFDEIVRIGLFAPSEDRDPADGMAAFSRWALVHRDPWGGRQVIYERMPRE